MKMHACILIIFLALSGCHVSKYIKSNKDKKSNTIRKKEIVSLKDSLSYLQSIVSNKAKYVHKELGILLNDLAIPVKSYTTPVISDRRYFSAIFISFDDSETTHHKLHNIRLADHNIELYIEWERPILRSEIQKVLNSAGGNWNSAEQKLYSKLIVGDIK